MDKFSAIYWTSTAMVALMMLFGALFLVEDNSSLRLIENRGYNEHVLRSEYQIKPAMGEKRSFLTTKDFGKDSLRVL